MVECGEGGWRGGRVEGWEGGEKQGRRIGMCVCRWVHGVREGGMEEGSKEGMRGSAREAG